MAMKELKVSSSITDRDTLLDKYFVEVQKFDQISAEQEAELARRRNSGDRHAVEELVRANLRFVISVAKHYQHKGLPLADLINEGNL
jgi:RNA polymerase primary sigma factor